LGARSSPPIFHEVQRFGQIWVWLLVLMTSALAWWGTVQQLILKKPFGSRPTPDAVMLLIGMVFGIGFPLFFLSLRLITEVRPDGICVRFVPLQRRFKRWACADIVGYELVTYRPIRDYGGWGIRSGPEGRAYNVSGNRGVKLTLRSRNRLLIGSQRPEQLAAALDAVGLKRLE
jgi:hypothetical protein